MDVLPNLKDKIPNLDKYDIYWLFVINYQDKKLKELTLE